jgi:hypothetical protein
MVGFKLIITILTWFHDDICIDLLKGRFNLKLSNKYFGVFQVRLSNILMNIFPMNPKLNFGRYNFLR